MEANNEIQLKIENGPSQDVLFDACKYCGHKNIQAEVDFLVSLEYVKSKHDTSVVYLHADNVSIRGIHRADWAGDELILYGYCRLDIGAYRNEEESGQTRFEFKAHYHSKTRKGILTISDNSHHL